MPFRPKLLHRLLDEGNEGPVEISILRARALRGPVVDLRSAVGELCDRDVPDFLALKRVTETQLGAEGVIETGRAKRFPAPRCFEPAAKVVLERNAGIVVGECRVPAQCPEFLGEGSLPFHVAMSRKNKKLDQTSFFIRPSFERSFRRDLLPNRAEISVRIVHAMLKLAESPIVVMQAAIATNFDRIMRGRNVFRLWIRFRDNLLACSNGVHVLAIVHAPDRLGAKLADVEPQIRSLQVAPPTGEKVSQIRAIFRFEILAEHVILALMPHEAFDAIRFLHSIQLRQRRLHMVQRERIKLKPAGTVGIPVLGQGRAARCDLDNGDRIIQLLRQLPTETEFWPEEVPRWLQGNPALGFRHLLSPHLVREQHVFLGPIQAGKRRKSLNIRNPRMRADHIRLPGEDKHPQCLAVGLGTKAKCWNQK